MTTVAPYETIHLDGALEEALLGEGLERINRGFGKDGAASSEDGSKDVLHVRGCVVSGCKHFRHGCIMC